jgi:hypothetical protein
MPDSFTLRVPEDDLAVLRTAHKRLLRHFSGQAMPLEMLALIALRSIDPEFLASEVLAAVTGKPAEAPDLAVAG